MREPRKWIQGKRGWKFTFGSQIKSFRCNKCRLVKYRYQYPVIKFWRRRLGRVEIYTKYLPIRRGSGTGSVTLPIKKPCRCLAQDGTLPPRLQK